MTYRKSTAGWQSPSSVWVMRALCGIFALGLACGHANAQCPSGDPFTCTFTGFPPSPFVQQDKTFGDFSGTLPSGFTTLVTTRILAGEDLHTISISGSFEPATTYTMSYSIAGTTPNVDVRDASAGIINTTGAGTISTELTNVPFTLPTTSSSTGLLTIPGGPFHTLDLTNTIQTDSGDVTSFANSFVEEVPIPEPGTMALMGSGVLAAAGLLQRRIVKRK